MRHDSVCGYLQRLFHSARGAFWCRGWARLLWFCGVGCCVRPGGGVFLGYVLFGGGSLPYHATAVGFIVQRLQERATAPNRKAARLYVYSRWCMDVRRVGGSTGSVFLGVGYGFLVSRPRALSGCGGV